VKPTVVRILTTSLAAQGSASTLSKLGCEVQVPESGVEGASQEGVQVVGPSVCQFF